MNELQSVVVLIVAVILPVLVGYGCYQFGKMEGYSEGKKDGYDKGYKNALINNHPKGSIKFKNF